MDAASMMMQQINQQNQQNMANWQAQQQTQNQIRQMQLQTQLDTQKTNVEMAKMLKDFSTTTFKTNQEATFYAANTKSQMNKKAEQYLKA